MIVTGSCAATGTALQRLELRRWLAHIDVDLVDLLHHRHRLGIGHADQRTFGHQRLVDAAGNRRADRGIAQVELATARIARASFTAARACSYSALASSRCCWLTACAAASACRRCDCTRLRPSAASLRCSAASAESTSARNAAGSIWNRAWPARTSALLEQAALHDAAHLGTDLRGAYGGHAAGQFVIALHHLRADSDHADARCGFGRGFGGGAGRHGQGEAAINATGVLKVLIAVHNAARAADRF
jgi:hypothetical protein